MHDPSFLNLELILARIAKRRIETVIAFQEIRFDADT